MTTVNANHLPPAVRQALDIVLDYLWDSEAADFRACCDATQSRHVFAKLLAIRRWLTAREKNLTNPTTPWHRVQTPPLAIAVYLRNSCGNPRLQNSLRVCSETATFR